MQSSPRRRLTRLPDQVAASPDRVSKWGPVMSGSEISIRSTRVLDSEGKIVGAMPEFARNPTILLRLYRALVLTRTFDTKAVALQRTGRLGTYASSLGQEAVAVGAAAAMELTDVFVPSFREHGGQLWRGVTLKELFLYWGGDERGNDFSSPREAWSPSLPPTMSVMFLRRTGRRRRSRSLITSSICGVGRQARRPECRMALSLPASFRSAPPKDAGGPPAFRRQFDLQDNKRSEKHAVRRFQTDLRLGVRYGSQRLHHVPAQSGDRRGAERIERWRRGSALLCGRARGRLSELDWQSRGAGKKGPPGFAPYQCRPDLGWHSAISLALSVGAVAHATNGA